MVENTQLTIDDLGDIYGICYGASTKWYEIGLKLKVPVSTLDSIDASTTDTTQTFRRMLNHWLKISSNRTWESLGSAMGSGEVGRQDLKEQIIRIHGCTASI